MSVAGAGRHRPLPSRRYLEIVRHYEGCLAAHGDTHLGVDWPKADDVPVRYRVMLDLIESRPISRRPTLLDFGCGASHLYEFAREGGYVLDYSGLDISERFVALSKRKFPENRYFCVDILAQDVRLPTFDFVVMNGVFTEKRGLSFEEMFEYFTEVIRRVFAITRVGLAFNVMSQHVDWQREDLFHLPFDVLARFLRSDVSKSFVFRADYGLYEYTTYVYR